MDPGEQITGTRDEHYNLISVLYHALQGADTCTAYALDAEAAGDGRLAEFFREAGVIQTQLADRAKGLLGITGSGVAPEPPPGDLAGGISPGDIAGGIPPGDVAGAFRHDRRTCSPATRRPGTCRPTYPRPTRPAAGVRGSVGVLSFAAFSLRRRWVRVRLERKLLEEVVAMCYSYRDYREEEEARRKRQEELRRQRQEEAQQARKKVTSREKVLVKS